MILGALVKFIPALLVPVIAVIAFRELQGRARLRYLALSAVIGGLMIVIFYAPYWHGIDPLGINRRASLYTGSVATLVRQTLGPVFDGQTGEAYQTPNTNNVIKWAILGISALFYLEMLERVYRAMGLPHPRLAALDSPSPNSERESAPKERRSEGKY